MTRNPLVNTALHRPKGLDNHHVMEEVGEADGYHQTLRWFPSYGSELEADGAVW